MTKKEPYFGKDVEQAIVEFCKTNNQRLYEVKIHPALSKLAENRIHRSGMVNFGSSDYTEMKHDCVCFLYNKLHKFDPDRGSKAFSYFDRISINWANAKLRDIAEETYGKCDVLSIDLNRDLDSEVYSESEQDDLKDFCYKWSQWGNNHIQYFYFIKNDKIVPFDKKERQVLNAVFNLFENSHSIDIYRKKALYILIREQVNVKTQTITNVINVLRPLCKEMLYEYKISGTKYWHRYLYYPDGLEPELEKDLEEQ